MILQSRMSFPTIRTKDQTTKVNKWVSSHGEELAVCGSMFESDLPAVPIRDG